MPQAAKSKKSTTSGSANSRSKSGSTGKAADSSRSAASGQQAGGSEMLEKFMYDSLKDIYWAEKHLMKALPKLSKAATNDELVSALDEHLEVTEEHVARLE